MLSINTVTTNADFGAGSLRQAIIDANATSANDEIIFASSLFANGATTITLGSSASLPTIAATSGAGSLTITGPGASSLTIDANKGNFSIFTINTGGNLSISGVTVTGANTSSNGGGFNNKGTLNLSNSTISGNDANIGAGIFNQGGTVTVTSSTLSGNSGKVYGGGIFNLGSGNLTVTNSTISGNTSLAAAGIFNYNGTLTVSNSTISGNTASNKGGGIYNLSTATVTNSTISGNSSAGGGGIYNRSTATLNIANTIIANSTKGGDYAGGGTVNLSSPSTAANNLVSQGSFPWATTKTSSEINLGSLANNGGPTQTLALLTGSVAIAAGNATISNAAPVNGLDQRGVTRSSTAPSIGAFEYVPPVASQLGLTTNAAGSVTGLAFTTQPVVTLQDSLGATVTTNNSPVTMTVSSGATTVGTTTVNAVAGVATFSGVGINGTVGTAYTLTFVSAGLTSATQSITPLGAASTPTFGTPTSTADGFTVQIGNYDSNFTYGGTATANGTVSIDTSGFVTVSGVAANTACTATITTTQTNYESGSAQVTATSLAVPTVTSISPTGGSIAGGTTITITGTDFTGATAVTIDGVTATNVTVLSSTIITATTPAGTAGTASVLVTTPIGTNAANTLFTYSAATFTVVNNSDSGTGSLRQAISDANATAGNDIIDFSFGSGSSPYTITLASALPSIADTSTAGTLTVSGLGATVLTIDGNQGNFSIFTIVQGGDLTISGVTVTGANTSSNGGGFNNNGTLSISNSTITLNTSSSNANGGGAGGIFNNTGATLTVSDSNITSNTGRAGGGIHNFGGTVTVSDTTISANKTVSNRDNRGGAIYNNTGSILTVSNSTLSGNSAVYAGGGIGNKGVATINNSTIASNKSLYGGGIFNEGGIITLTSSTIALNSASIDGGGIQNGGILTIGNVIISNNVSSGGTANYQSYGGGNVGFVSPSTAANNVVPGGTISGAITTDPALGPLQDNGGPTSTMAIGIGSSANGTGNATVSNASPIFGLDQRGYARSSTTPSIGAYEYNGTVPAAPTVTSISPSAGSTAGGTSITITGTDIAGATSVTIGGTAVNFTVVSATTITATTPAGSSGTASILVTTPSGTNAANTLFTYGTAPTVTLNTTNSLAINATTLILSGTGFDTTAVNNVVTFNSGTGTVTNATATQLTVTFDTAPSLGSLTAIVTTNAISSGNAVQVADILNAANTPTFGPPTATVDGFTVQISNYDSNFSYVGTATANGTVAIDSSGFVTVSGLAANTSSTATITTTQTNYESGSAQVTATSLNAANTPTFGPPTATADGFTVQISNYDSNFTYGGTATANGTVSIDSSGFVTVNGVAANTACTATITTTQAGYASGLATVTETSAPAAATRPGRPTSVVATRGNASLGVTWVAPASNGGSNIIEYIVKYSSNNGAAGSWTRYRPGSPITATSCTVTGLTNGTAYVIKVIARNSVGISPPSANSAPATPAAATVPGRPTSVVATSGNASLGVTWVAPASNGGSIIIEYIVKYSRNNGAAGSWTRYRPNSPITATSCTVTGLTNGTPYVIKVIARNAVGISLPSANSAPVTPA